MAIQSMQNDGGLSDITTLLNLVKDQKTSSTTSTNISDAGVQAQINEILGSNQGLAAVAGAQKNAGFYNSTVNTQLVNDLLSRTSAQVAARNASTTTTQSKKAPLSNTQAALSLATIALKNKDLLKTGLQKLTGQSAVNPLSANSAAASIDSTTPELSAIDTSGAVGDTLSSIPSVGGGVGESIGTADSGGIYDTLAQAFSDAGYEAGTVGAADTASTAAAGTADVAGLESLDSAAAAQDSAAALGGASAAIGAGEGTAAGADAALGGFGAGAAATGYGALAIAGAADAADTFSSGDKDAQIASIVGGLGTGDIVRGLDSGSPLDSVNPLGQGIVKGIGDAIGVDTTKGWIVCTELLKQGRMPKEYYVPGLRVFRSYRLDLLDGYYIWAVPSVRLLQEKPFCLRSRALCYIFNKRAKYLASKFGSANAVDNVVGAVISATVYGICYVLGQALKAQKGMKRERYPLEHS